MKLIVTGATGFVGTHLLRQAINHPDITSVVALARKPTPSPSSASASASASPSSKFTSLVCDNFNEYSPAIKQHLADADAVIWLLAVTPSKAKGMPWEDVRRICHGYTVTALEALAPSRQTPLRFVYVSGANAERDASRKPWIMGDMCVLRGEVENRVLDAAAQSDGALESCVLKPGLITGPGSEGLLMSAAQVVLKVVAGVPSLAVAVADVAAAALDLAVRGFDRDTFVSDDIVRIGQEARAALRE